MLAVVQTFLFLVENYYAPSFDFTAVMFLIPDDLRTMLIFVISIFNLYLALVLLIYIFARRIPVIMSLLEKKFKEE